MDVQPSSCLEGGSTKVNLAFLDQKEAILKIHHEKVNVQFEFPYFVINKAEEEIEDGSTVHIQYKFSFDERTSDCCRVGQYINIPTTWRLKVSHTETHARIMLLCCECSNVSSDSEQHMNFKFTIGIADQDWNFVHLKICESWDSKILTDQGICLENFIGLKELYQNRAYYVPGNKLRLRLEGTLYGDFQHVPILGLNELKPSVSPLALELWNNKMEFSDIELVSKDGKSAPAHKFILSNVGPTLSSMVKEVSESPEGSDDDKSKHKLHLRDVSESEMSKMLQFIYTGDVKQDWSNLQEVERLLDLSHRFDLQELERICIENIRSALTVSRFVEMVKIFQGQFSDLGLLSVFNSFFLANEDKLVCQQSFQEFVKESKDAFLSVLFGESRFSGSNEL